METSLKKLQQASDAVLIRLFQRGSNRAFYVLVRRHQANLKKYAHTLLRNSTLEKDAIQNVWIEIITRLQKRKYKETGHFKEWGQSLLYWRIANIQKEEAHYIHEMPPEKACNVSGAADKILYEERLKQMRKSYARLNKHLRTVVQLRVYKNMSFPEIAHVMHASTGTVTSWYSRAVKKLRKLTRK
jgi:RNA polymerase sigma factor (sigma-70 family)